MNYGYTLSLDIHNCDNKIFNRRMIEEFLIQLCEKIGMQREDLHWWDYEGQNTIDEPDHLVGTSVVQFITTSTIVIHTLDRLNKMYVDLFSCNEFDPATVMAFTSIFFEGEIVNYKYYERI